MTYPNAALEDVCTRLIEQWGLTQEQIKNLAGDLPGECEFIRKIAEEQEAGG